MFLAAALAAPGRPLLPQTVETGGPPSDATAVEPSRREPLVTALVGKGCCVTHSDAPEALLAAPPRLLDRAGCAAACAANPSCASFAVAGCEGEEDGACEGGHASAKSQCDELQGQHCDANCFLYSSAPKMREDGGCGWEWLEDRTFCFVRRPADGTAKLVAFTDPELLTEVSPSPPSSPSATPPPPPPPLTAVTFILRMPVAAGPVLASVIVNGQRYPMYPDAGTVEVSPLAQAAGATLPTLSPPPPPEGAAGGIALAGRAQSPESSPVPSSAEDPCKGAETHSGADVGGAGVGTFCRSILLPLGRFSARFRAKDATAPTTMDEVVPRECGAVEPAGLTVPETTHREGVVQGGGGRQVVGPFAFGSCSAYPDGEQPPSACQCAPPPPSPPPAARSPPPPPSPGEDCPPPPPKPLGCAFVKGQGDGSRRRLDPAVAGGASGWRLSECADLVVRLAPEASGATINFDDGACYAELEMTRAVPGCANQCRPRDWRALLARSAKRAAADENALVVPPPSDDSTALAGGAYDCHQCSQMWTCRFGGWPPPPPPSPVVRPPPPSPPPPPAPPAPPPPAPPAPPPPPAWKIYAGRTCAGDVRHSVKGAPPAARRAPPTRRAWRSQWPPAARASASRRRRARRSTTSGRVGGARSPCAAARLLGARRVVRRPHRDHQERSQLPEVDGAVAAHPPRHAARAAGRRARRPPLLPPGGRGGGVVLHDGSGPAPRGMHAAELRRLLHGARPLVLLGVARMLLGVCVTRHFNS